MNKRSKWLFSLFIIICLILTQIIMTGIAAAETTALQRLYGNNRYMTAIAICQDGWNASDYAVLARGDNFADALCAGPLAEKFGAPILLTEPNELNANVLTELKRLGVSHVFIIGGTGAVSSSAESALKLAGIAFVERIYGDDRFETSVKIAEKLGSIDKIVLATANDYPDALSILLSNKDSLPDIINRYLSDKTISKSYVIGGVGVLSDTVKNAVPNAVRLGGKDRYDTNALVMQEFAGSLNFNNVYVAVGEGPSGNEFADALSGAVLAAKTASPVILAYKTLPNATASFIKTKLTPESTVTALGGEAVVPSSVLDGINGGTNNQNQDTPDTSGDNLPVSISADGYCTAVVTENGDL